MRIFGMEIRRAETERRADSLSVRVSQEGFLQALGLTDADLPTVTIDSALRVPAVMSAIGFLPRTLAALPLHSYERKKEGPERIDGPLQTLVHEAPNDETTSFGWRTHFWQSVFTRGRGLSWIERGAQGEPIALWPMEAGKTSVMIRGGKRVYKYDGQASAYPAADVIDVPFMLKSDGLGSYSPIALAAQAIQLALAMEKYGAKFFAGGGVPPLSIEGPIETGEEAMKRANEQIHEAIETAKKQGKPVFRMPAGYKLNPLGFDPEKGQMTEARRFSVEEIARVFNLPPVFLQDLSKGTFSNTEQQDLFLVKHTVSQWVQAFEEELNLKLFGRRDRKRYVEHNVDGLLRGDFKSRMDGLARAVQGGFYYPNDARKLEGLPDDPEGGKLMMQGATVPIGSLGDGESDD